MINVGITGSSGFIGYHLKNTLGLYKDKYKAILINRECFSDQELLDKHVDNCDVIIHLAGVNRSENPDSIYLSNISLTEKLRLSLLKSKNKPKIIFASSTQEGKENHYGKSKNESRKLLEQWASDARSKCLSLIIPNVFGPFAKPFHNSFVATFCYQLTVNSTPQIFEDVEVNLIYVSDLVRIIVDHIDKDFGNEMLYIPSLIKIRVSALLKYLESFKKGYFYDGVIPKLESYFELCLFNTFRSYINLDEKFPKAYSKHTDDRGFFSEIIRTNIGGQVSFSATNIAFVRGNHFHTRKIERFSVIKGSAKVQLRMIGTELIKEFYFNGENPSYIDIPIWYTHNIINIGNEELYTVFWINEPFDEKDPDTFLEIV